MSDNDKLEYLDKLLSSGVVGIDGDQFVFNQTAILSAMAKTDRQLLIRILAKVTRWSNEEKLMQESIKSDIEHLTELMESTSKVVK